MIENKEEYLFEEFVKHNITLNKRQVCQFLAYFDFLVEWNEKINLTSITEFSDVCLKHFIDSSCIVKLFNSYEEASEFFFKKTLCDVGTGAGFPGICLKILFPDLEVFLFDSLDKRIKFLDVVIEKLSLDGIHTVHGRAEDLAKNSKYREVFDFSTARAVASLPVLSEYCLPFVKVGGAFIPYKSEKVNEELELSKRAFGILGGELDRTVSFHLGEADYSRSILLIKKVFSTPSLYPRKAGTPSKKPL